MRLSKVAKELNVGIANVIDHLASKGIEIDGRPNTKITPESYKILKQEFSADVEQHKRSEEIAQARREEKEAIKIAAVKNSAAKEVIKAKADFTGPKTIGKITIESKKSSKKDSQNPAKVELSNKETASEVKSPKELTEKIVEKRVKSDSKKEVSKEGSFKNKAAKKEESNAIKPAASKDVIKAKGSVTGPKQIGKIDVNKPVKSDDVKEIKVEKLNKIPTPEVVTEEPVENEVLRAKSKTLSGPKLTGQVIDLSKFAKPKKKKVASSSNPSGDKDNKKKRKRINSGSSGGTGRPVRPNQKAGSRGPA